MTTSVTSTSTVTSSTVTTTASTAVDDENIGNPLIGGNPEEQEDPGEGHFDFAHPMYLPNL